MRRCVPSHHDAVISDYNYFYDESPVVCQVFSNYEDEGSIFEEQSQYDELKLSDLVVRLREAGALDVFDGHQSLGLDDGYTEDVDVTDSMIALHLKTLSSKKCGLAEDLSETDDMSISADGNDDCMSLCSFDTNASMGGRDEGSVIDTSYFGIEKIMNKLGVNIEAEVNISDRQWLVRVGKHIATLDFVDAPQTIASKKIWLANLAAELTLEDWSDDESVSTKLVEIDVKYQQNRERLANQTRFADMLMATQPAVTELEHTTKISDSRPNRLWELPQVLQKTSPTAAELLATQARALALKQAVLASTATLGSAPQNIASGAQTVATTSSLRAAGATVKTKSIYAGKPELPNLNFKA